jgi:hypothetical protein
MHHAHTTQTSYHAFKHRNSSAGVTATATTVAIYNSVHLGCMTLPVCALCVQSLLGAAQLQHDMMVRAQALLGMHLCLSFML